METPLIQSIHSIEDLKRIDAGQLDALASEIRSFLVGKVSLTGGHLASNLGVVELTLALHRAFDSPRDKIIFDVGHQSYVHKLVTGRAAEFDTLRKKAGLSGFPKYEESVHDAFNTGHASTSISAALGMLRAMRLNGEAGEVVAVVGDGALTGGLCFEALNDAGQSQLPLIVVINDNDMSIARNVGALNRHLSDMRASAAYQRLKGRVAHLLRSIPRIGMRLSNSVLRFKTKLKYLILPNIIFEELGFTYLGPLDGHDIKAMINVFCQAKELERPVVVHVITKKGKGYALAEHNPEKFHGIASFDADNGAVEQQKAPSNSSVFGKALCECAGEDARIIAITAAMPQGTGLDRFASLYPSRFFDVGIAEAHAVTMAAGMAMSGAKPVVAVYSTFLQRAYDEVLHDVCLQRLPVVFAVDRAGLVGEDGETHQGVYDIAYLSAMPGMTILSPATQAELREMLPLALALQAPAALRYNRGSLWDKPLDGEVQLGKWQLLRPLRGINIIATGRLVERAMQAADGLDVGVVNARFIKPMDDALLESVIAGSRAVVTLEDGVKSGGMGMRIAAAAGARVKVYALGIGDAPVCHASINEQDELSGIDCESIRRLLIKLLEENA